MHTSCVVAEKARQSAFGVIILEQKGWKNELRVPEEATNVAMLAKKICFLRKNTLSVLGERILEECEVEDHKEDACDD